jgi:hypothetical protein
MHHHGEQQAERVGQYVALAAEGFLARVVARWVECPAPFCVPFDVWLSMIAVVGLAARPDCSRTATWSAWWRRSSVPSHSQREK